MTTKKTTPKVHKLNASTWLASVTYHAGVLTLQKRDGGTLVYSQVPSWVIGLLFAHPSAGRAYNLLVKNRYTLAASVPAPAPKPEPQQDLSALLLASIDQAQGRRQVAA